MQYNYAEMSVLNVKSIKVTNGENKDNIPLQVSPKGGGGTGGGGANTKVPDMYGVGGGGGVFGDPKHKSNMYTFVQQRGVVHILSRITKV